MYSEPCETSKIELFEKIVNNWKLLPISAKTSILDVWQGSEYAPVNHVSVSCDINCFFSWHQRHPYLRGKRQSFSFSSWYSTNSSWHSNDCIFAFQQAKLRNREEIFSNMNLEKCPFSICKYPLVKRTKVDNVHTQK